MTDTAPQCPEALYSPDTDTLRRCIRDPREHDWRDWHEAEGGIEWRPSAEDRKDTLA
ncbi:hypothetical protein ACFZDM_33575 [Streptomyces californicus]|uniref:hypothetical protein n=1 Tax=Streptomyces californicus TaxID=67351 RepID=UPI0036EB7628